MPAQMGVLLVPNWSPSGTNVLGNLIRNNDGTTAYPIGGSNTANAGDMAKSSLTATGIVYHVLVKFAHYTLLKHLAFDLILSVPRQKYINYHAP